jgi:Putative addiction module component
MAAALGNVLAQALQLNDEERGELMALLLRSFEPDDGDELDATAWDAAWSAALDRRVAEIREGEVDLVDGDEARARVRAAISRRR